MVMLMRSMQLSMQQQQQQQASQLHSVLAVMAALRPQHAATAAAEPVVR
jgi:hypothetical protein